VVCTLNGEIVFCSEPRPGTTNDDEEYEEENLRHILESEYEGTAHPKVWMTT
jgi:hypothetical protein